MPTLNLLYKNEYKINEHITIRIPKIHEILENEDDYYSMVLLITSMPIDMMVQLDDIGVDFTTINEYELFLLLFNSLQKKDTSLIFGNLNLQHFKTAINEANNTVILLDEQNGIVIDRAIYEKIASILRKLHNIKKNTRKPGNVEAKDYMIQRARDKMRRQNNRTNDSHLEELIIALVNTEQFYYGFEGTQELSIYQFNESVRQIIKKIDYDNKMRGIYAGTVSAKDLSQEDLNWLIHK